MLYEKKIKTYQQNYTLAAHFMVYFDLVSYECSAIEASLTSISYKKKFLT